MLLLQFIHIDIHTFCQNGIKKLDVKHGINERVDFSYFSDVDFVDDKNGWIVSSNGLIKHTNDGGKTWINQTSPIKTLFNKVQFVNKDYGWILGDSNTILRTENGGKNWTNITPKNKSVILSSYFLTPQKGWIIHSNGIFKTTDGGVSWERIYDTHDGYFLKIIFSDSLTGFVLHENGLLKTTDGGNSWEFMNVSASQKTTLTNLSFYDSLNGVIIGNNPDLMLFTQDGGKTWTENRVLQNPSNYEDDYSVFDVFYLNANQVLISTSYILYESINQGETWSNKMYFGEYGGGQTKIISPTKGFFLTGKQVLKTTDAGLTWNPIYNDVWSSMYDIFFIDTKNGWSVGANGTILHTKDAGETWENQISNVRVGLGSVYFATVSKGWITGVNGLVLQTADGGKTWNSQKLNIELNLDEKSKQMIEEFEFENGNCFNHNIRRIQMIDENKGWIMSQFRSCLGHDIMCFFRTENGGLTWLYQERLEDLKFQDILFINMDTAFAIRNKSLFRSNDQGKTWRAASLGNCNYFIRTLYQVSDSILHIVTSNSLFVYNFQNGERIQFALPKRASRFSDYQSIQFHLESSGFYLVRNQIFTVRVGMRTMFSSSQITKEGDFKSSLNSIFVINPLNIWVVGSNGLIAKLELLN